MTAHRTPPKARATFRIGVVGHRPNRLPEDTARLNLLRTTLGNILEYAKASVGEVAATPGSTLYNDEPPVLRAVSPLAEGSDRIFAELALALDYELCSPLPFSQGEFEKDFVPPDALETESLTHFRALLNEARDSHHLTLFELDGARDHATDAYAAAGRVVLNQSDLLVAVWDGGDAAGPGGTVHTIYEALRFHLPVIWIDAQEPQNWQLVSVKSDITRNKEGRFQPVAQDKSLEGGCQPYRADGIAPAAIPENIAPGLFQPPQAVRKRGFLLEDFPRPGWRPRFLMARLRGPRL